MAVGPGFRIHDGWDRPSATLLDGFHGLTAANIGDAMNRMGVVGNDIRPMWSGGAFVGSALTVWTRAGDNLMVHKAISTARPGDVLVVNGQGDRTRALLGELMARSALTRGVAGFVVDGAVRDVNDIAAMSMPVHARCATPAGPFKEGPGEIGLAVACGGVVCLPGDVVVGDDEGVVVVPRLDAHAVLQAARRIRTAEAARRAEIENGRPERAGIDEQLVEVGVLAAAPASGEEATAGVRVPGDGRRAAQRRT